MIKSAVRYTLLGAIGYFVALILYMNGRQYLYSTQPDLFPDFYINALKPEGKLKECPRERFRHIETVYGVHDFDTVFKRVENLKKPILFKHYTSKNLMPHLDDALEKRKSEVLDYTEVDITGFGNLFHKGFRTDKGHNATLGELMRNWTDPTAPSVYLSFIPFLDAESIEKILPGVDYSKFLVDTNFMSNFKEDVVSATLHSAPPVSFSFQIVGSKLWVFAPPSAMQTFDPVFTPVCFPVGATEVSYFKSVKESEIALAEEGDLLVFPPLYGHTVITKAGPNLMFNLRQSPTRAAIIRHPLLFIQMIVSDLLSGKERTSKKDGKRVPFSYALPGLLEEKAGRTGHVTTEHDSPCKDYWKDILNNKISPKSF